MVDPAHIQHLIRALGDRTVCASCAAVFLELLDKVRRSRSALPTAEVAASEAIDSALG